MISDNKINEITKELLEKSFYNYFVTAQKETKHIILDRFFPQERRITSTMTGLQTSLGTFWEKLSVALATENNISILDNSSLVKPENIPADLQLLINNIKGFREKNGGELTQFKLDLNNKFALNSKPNCPQVKMIKGKGADVILKKGNDIYLFDIKTVHVNANSGNSFNETVILWTAFYKYMNGIDADNVKAMLVFPYNSSDENNDDGWWNDFGGRISPLTKNDFFVGNQYWSFLTDNKNALKQIISAIEELNNDKGFKDLYQKAFEADDRDGLVVFSEEVRLQKIKGKFNVELLSNESPWNLRKKFKWRHNGSCVFDERLNKLLKSDVYKCTTCDTYI
jgi:hypothetical protein